MKKLGIFLFLCFWVQFTPPVQALTLSDLQADVRILIKDTSTSRQRYTDAQLTKLINEAQRDVVVNTLPVDSKITATLIAGDTCYIMPETFIHVKRVTYDDILLPEASLIKLDSDNGGSKWETVAGRPITYYQGDQSNGICFYPFPNSSTDVGTVKIIYNHMVPNLVNASDVPFNSETRFYSYHNLLEFYVAYRIYLLEGQTDRANLYRAEYENRVQLMGAVTGTIPNYSPGMAGPSTSRGK